MAVGDGVIWNEALPDNTTLASEIDDYDRDLRVGVRSRMALEHVWPAAHTGTSSGGRHTYITFQPQTAAPTMAGTTGGGLYVSTEVSPRLIFTRSNGTDVTIVNTAGNIPLLTTGTQGSIIIASSANANSIITLAGSADGRVLHTHATTAAPNWLPIDLAGTSTVLTGILAVANGGVGQATTGLAFGAKIITYEGDGLDNKTIAHSLGRVPIFVIIAKNETDVNGMNLWMTGFGAASREFSSGGWRTDAIKGVDATNITVGTHDEVNTNAKTYCIFLI